MATSSEGRSATRVYRAGRSECQVICSCQLMGTLAAVGDLLSEMRRSPFGGAKSSGIETFRNGGLTSG